MMEFIQSIKPDDLLYPGLVLFALVFAVLITRARYQGLMSRRELDYERELSELRSELVRLQERLEQRDQAADEKLELLRGARNQLGEEFNNLANRIFEEKSRRLVQTNRDTLETTLSPLKTQLKDFRKRVDDVYDKETRDRVSLLHELGQLKELNKQMSQDAHNLTRALKGDKKTQGNWGEVILERVLEESGLRKGHEYDTQVASKSEEGRRLLPDVVVRLPDNKDIVIDAKVSLVDYERYINSEDDVEKKAFLAAHVHAIKQHIDGLSLKGYEQLEGLRSLDFVLLFIPIESAFIAAFDSDPSMFKQAYDKQIIVVSPTTLLATLRTVQTIWRYEQQNRNAEKIARQAGGIYDQFALLLESLGDIGKHLDKAHLAYDKTVERFTTGRGNLARRVQQLEELGARTKKKLPANLVEPVDDDAAPDEESASLIDIETGQAVKIEALADPED